MKPRMPYLGILGNNLEKSLSYLKPVLSNLPYWKVWCKKKKSFNLGPKMLDLHILGLEYLKSTPSNLSHCKILWNNVNA